MDVHIAFATFATTSCSGNVLKICLFDCISYLLLQSLCGEIQAMYAKYSLLSQIRFISSYGNEICSLKICFAALGFWRFLRVFLRRTLRSFDGAFLKTLQFKSRQVIRFYVVPRLGRAQVNSGQQLRPCEGCEGPPGRQITDVASEGASVKSVARSAPAAL